jgi:2-oxoisovalerate dehydrogenase E1 component alpha subunit
MLPFSHDEAKHMFKTMLRVSVVDQILNSLQRQGRISFYMTGVGEEAAQVGSAAGLEPHDVVWPQYRELGCFMYRGFTIQQVVDQCMSRKDEPGKGRQMPVHYCDSKLSMQAVTSPLATQIPQVAGAGYAFRTSKENRVAVAYCGDGSASEGDFAVGLNFAATLKAQAIFLCRNNGWAISTDVREQYCGDGVAVRGPAYGMSALRVDGNDLAAVYSAVKMARDHCVQAGEPVIVEMMTYRRGHHSTSDDATRYRQGQEVASMSRSGLEPISRMRLLLQDAGFWTEEEETSLRDATREEIMTALKIAEGKKFAAIADMFQDVWATPPPNLQQQQAELEQHIDRHRDKYPSLAQFASS